jgi:2,2-dialkylglycine decarboxylase (pyruvate)
MSSILGHSHPEVLATIREAAGRLDHLFSAMISEPVVSLAEKLAEQVPQLPKSMFLSTGGEANEAAIKLAKTVTGKWEIVTFTKSYHGVTAGSAAATFKIGRTGVGPLAPGYTPFPRRTPTSRASPVSTGGASSTTPSSKSTRSALATWRPLSASQS